jgi:fumarate reductase subunit D
MVVWANVLLHAPLTVLLLGFFLCLPCGLYDAPEPDLALGLHQLPQTTVLILLHTYIMYMHTCEYLKRRTG